MILWYGFVCHKYNTSMISYHMICIYIYMIISYKFVLIVYLIYIWCVCVFFYVIWIQPKKLVFKISRLYTTLWKLETLVFAMTSRVLIDGVLRFAYILKSDCETLPFPLPVWPNAASSLCWWYCPVSCRVKAPEICLW